MNPSYQSETLDTLLANARNCHSEVSRDSTAPFGLTTRVLAELKEIDSYDSISLWKRSSLALCGMSLATIIFLNFESDLNQSRPTAAILPLPALDLSDAAPPLK